MATNDPLVQAIITSADDVEEATPSPNAQNVTNLVERLGQGDIPDGFDINGIVAADMETQRELEAKAMDILGTVNEFSNERRATASQALTASQDLSRTIVESASAQTSANEADLAVDKAELDEDLVIQDRIRALNEEQLSELATVDSTLDDLTSSANSNYEILKANAEAGFMDFLKDPLGRIKLGMAAKKAEKVLAVETRQIEKLDAIRRTDAAAYQESNSILLQQVQLQTTARAQLYHKQIEAANIVNQANINRSISSDNLKLAGDTLNLQGAALDNFNKQLNALASAGSLTVQKYQAIASQAQITNAKLQQRQLEKLLADNDELQQSQARMFANFKEAYGVKYDSHEQFMADAQVGLVSDDLLITYSNYTFNGLVSSNNVFNSSNSVALGNAMNAAGQLPEGMADVITGVDRLKVNDTALIDDTTYAGLTKERKDELRNTQLRAWRAAIEQNIDNVYANKIPGARILSPDTMDYTAGKGLDQMPAKVVEIVSKWKLDTRNYSNFVEDFVRKVATDTSGTTFEQFAQAAASMSTMFLNGINNSTGLGLSSMSTSALANGNDSYRNGIDPESWISIFQIEKAKWQRVHGDAARAIRIN